MMPLEDDLEWKVLYVGSAEDTSHDQVLDEILVGPVPVGVNKFVLQADAPDISQIPEGDVLGVTVVLVTCSYREKEFVRVGYYVNNEYAEEYDEEKGPPRPLDMNKVRRIVLADKPRVTRFPIQWGDKDEAAAAAGQQSSATSGDDEGRGMIPTEDDDEGMTLDEMAGEEEEEDDVAEFDEEDEDDDVSLEGKDMMMGDLIMNNALSPEME
jgi:histone chaperone ASF1